MFSKLESMHLQKVQSCTRLQRVQICTHLRRVQICTLSMQRVQICTHLHAESANLHSSPCRECKFALISMQRVQICTHLHVESANLHSSPEFKFALISRELVHSSPKSANLHSSPESANLHSSPESANLHSSLVSAKLHLYRKVTHSSKGVKSKQRMNVMNNLMKTNGNFGIRHLFDMSTSIIIVHSL